MNPRAKRTAGLLLGAALALSAARAQSDEFEAKFRAGAEAMRASRFEEAAADFTQCVKLQPDFAEAHLNLALARFEQGQFEQATQALTRTIQLKSHLRGAHLFLGIARYRLNDLTGAAEALRKETAIDPANGTVWMWLGVVEMADNKPGQAAATLDKAAKLKPNDIDILYHQGRAHMLMSRDIYDRMFHLNPNSWRVHEVLAGAFEQSDRLDDAIKECQAAIKQKPEEPGLHQQLGDIYWKQNNLEQAEVAFAEEIRIDPLNISATYKLAVISLERSKPDVAAKLLKEVLQHYPHSVEAHYELGRALAQTGDSASAIPHFEAVVAQQKKADPDLVKQSYYQLAQSYRRLHRTTEAQTALNNFVQLKQQAEAREQQSLQDKLKRVQAGAPADVPNPREVRQ